MTDRQFTRRHFALLVSAAPVALRARAQARPRLLLMTGVAGGTFNEYGPVLAKIAAEHAGFDLDLQVSGGSNDNLRALCRGDADLGLVNLGPAYNAWTGKGSFQDGAYRSLRALFPIYDTPFSFIALRESGITAVSKLAGKVVGVGPAGGPSHLFLKGFAAACGLTIRIETGSPGEQSKRLLGREIDAFWFGAGPPAPAFVEIVGKADAVVFGLTETETALFRRVFAYASPGVVPAGTYAGQPEAIRTVAIWNFVVATDRLSDEVAYDLTRAAFEQPGVIAAGNPTPTGGVIATVLSDTFLPLHPGVLRWYREKGVEIPPAIMPP